MKLGLVTKRNKRTRQRQKNFAMTSCQQIVSSLSFLQFMANLEQSGSRIPDSWSIKLTFSLIIIFYLTKTENRTKNLYHSSHTIALSKSTIFAKKNAVTPTPKVKRTPKKSTQIRVNKKKIFVSIYIIYIIINIVVTF